MRSVSRSEMSRCRIGQWHAVSESWGSQKEENQPQSSWRQQKSSSGAGNGWSSDKTNSDSGFKSWDSNNNEKKSQSSCNNFDKRSNQTGKDDGVGVSKTWESRKEENSAQTTWGQPKDATWKNEKQAGAWGSKKTDQQGSSSGTWSNQSAKDNEVGGCKSWETKNGDDSNQSTWGQLRDATSKNNKQTDAWDSEKSDQICNSSSWGSGNQGSGSSDKVTEEDNSRAWDKTEEIKTQSSWGQPSKSTEKSSPSVDGWGSNKSIQPDSSSAWGSGKAESGSSDKTHEDSSGAWGSKSEDRKTQSSWGQWSETTWKSSPSADGWGAGKADNGGRGHSFGQGSGRSDNGGRGWGSSNSGEWKSRKNRLPRQPGSNEEPTNVAFTATRKRMDIFPVEEQDALSEVETIMQSIRRIMHQSGSNDGDPLPSDDQSYIINNVLVSSR